jgi:hypothetical protein
LIDCCVLLLSALCSQVVVFHKEGHLHKPTNS